MSPGVTKPVLILAALYLGILAGPAAGQGPNNKAGFVNPGQTATPDCLGGNEIVGGDNVLAVKGKYSNLDLAGSSNKITIEFGPAAKVRILGSNNAIVWTSVGRETADNQLCRVRRRSNAAAAMTAIVGNKGPLATGPHCRHRPDYSDMINFTHSSTHS